MTNKSNQNIMTAIFKKRELQNGRKIKAAVVCGGDKLSPCTVVLHRNTEQTRGSFENKTCVREDPARDGFSGVRQKRGANKQQTKLKKDYRHQKKDFGRSGNGRPRRNPHFEIHDSVLGARPACQLSRSLNSATAMLEAVADDALHSSCTDPELSAIDDVCADAELLPPLDCSAPTPSSSSGAQSSSQQARQGKSKRDSSVELLQYLERADERFLQHNKDMNDALLHRMEVDTSALLGLMGRMVAVMEAQTDR